MAAPVVSAQASADAYPMTIQFGTGLVNIPVAWTSPRSGDVWVNSSAKRLLHADNLNFAGQWNTNLAAEIHWLGRFTTGVSVYSQNPDYGFFGQLSLLRNGDVGSLPALAVGVRNLGPYTHEDRHLVGHDVTVSSNGSSEGTTAPLAANFKTSSTFYAVATKDLELGGASTSLTLGYGNGLFSDDGKLGKDYNEKGQLAKGLFFGARLVTPPLADVRLSLMAENDGWDYNAGAVADWRGVSLGVYGTELEEGGRNPAKCRDVQLCRVYNYAKVNVTLGYSGNLIDITRGILLRGRVDELGREQRRLVAEISSRQRRIAELEIALGKAQQGELETIARRRAELEQQIQQERDAIRAAEERVRQLQEGRPPATPPVTKPPSGSINEPLH